MERLICSIIVFFIWINCLVSGQDPKNDDSLIVTEEFTHLLPRASNGKKVHLLSELSRNGKRLQIEEYLDLEQWEQSIRFEWHYNESGATELLTHRLSFIIKNGPSKRFIAEYEPYRCKIDKFTSDKMIPDSDWIDSLKTITIDEYGKLTADSIYHDIIHSIMSTAKNSPYLARIPRPDKTSSNISDIWLFGVSALWIKAEFPGDTVSKVQLATHLQDKVSTPDSDHWILNLKDSDSWISYYFDDAILDNAHMNSIANSDYESLQMIELRRQDDGVKLIDLINIIDCNFGNTPIADILSLPIGYSCPEDPFLANDRLNFESNYPRSMLIHLEVVANKYKEIELMGLYSSSEIKNIAIAISKHPLNSEVSVNMFHIIEDQVKYVRDFHSKLSYRLSSDFTGNVCDIERLHIQDFDQRMSKDHVDIKFTNGITISFNEPSLDYLLNHKFQKGNSMKLLHMKQVSNTEEQLVFESQMAEDEVLIFNILDRKRQSIKHSSTIIRVYTRQVMEKRIEGSVKSFFTRGSLRLSQVILMAFDMEHKTLLADLTINIIERIEPLSFTRKSHLFDISQCHEFDDTMQLQVSYPADDEVINLVNEESHEFIESFYSSFMYWWDANSTGEDENDLDIDKRRLGMSLNFLRVPKVEISLDSYNSLELLLSVIDKPSPIHKFLILEETTFINDAIESEPEKTISESPNDCARFCQLFNCQMFAYDWTSQECRLSQISWNQVDNSDYDYSNQEVGDEQQPKLVIRETSITYYIESKSDLADIQAPLEEASLSDFLSFLEHYYMGALNNDDDSDSEVSRFKRSTIDDQPLLAIKLKKDSNNFGPPKLLTLVPNRIKPIKVPLVLDLSDENQKVRIASSFRTGQLNSSYQLRVLGDDEDDVGSFNSQERTFIDTNAAAYYTLKRFSIGFDSCASYCFNIDEWDDQTKGEQTCTSFSYCPRSKECVILVKTDCKFVNSTLDLVDEVDRVIEISSIDSLVTKDYGCSVKIRNYLTGFEGPLTLEPNFFGQESTDDFETKLNYEWLVGIRQESVDYPEGMGEKCAKMCLDYNKRGKKTCLTMDVCTRKYRPQYSNSSKMMYDVTCNLLLVLNEQSIDETSMNRRMARMRNELSQVKVKTSPTKRETKTNCHRYLMSHMRDFNHLRQRKLGDKLRTLLEKPMPTVHNLNLDGCAFECSIRASVCQAFEYCSVIDQSTKTNLRNCSFLGGAARMVTSRENSSILPETALSTYNRNCHIFLRKDMKSLEELLTMQTPKSSHSSNGLSILMSVVLVLVIIGSGLVCFKILPNPMGRIHSSA